LDIDEIMIAELFGD